MSDEGTVEIETGRSIELSEGRIVFVAKFPGRDQLAIGLRNSSGELTKLSLSTEAAAALAELIANPEAGTESAPPRDTSTWSVYKWKAIVTTEKPPLTPALR